MGQSAPVCLLSLPVSIQRTVGNLKTKQHTHCSISLQRLFRHSLLIVQDLASENSSCQLTENLVQPHMMPGQTESHCITHYLRVFVYFGDNSNTGT